LAYPGTSEREKAGCVYGIAFGLLVFLLLLATPFLVREGKVDGAELLAAFFREDHPPAGFELAEATKAPSGEVVLRLTRKAAGPDAAPDATQDASFGAGPVEVLLIELPSAAGVRSLFEYEGEVDDDGRIRVDDEASRKVLEWERKPHDWHTLLERNEMEWGTWRAPFVTERAFTKAGTWRDSIRVNLAQEGRNLVLFALWPEKVAAEKKALVPWLEAIEMRESEASPGS